MARKFNSVLTHERLVALLRYEPVEGRFYRLTNAKYGSRGRIGDKAGYQNPLGYRLIRIDSVAYREHRLAWFYVHKKWPRYFIDHIDGNPSNNAIANLREASDIQNQQNVDWRGYTERRSRRLSKPFEANINVNGKNVYLGMFRTADEAREAYLAANLKYFGEFSFHNRGSKKCTAL